MAYVHTFFQAAIAMGDIYGLSSRCVAAMISAVMVDLGMITKTEREKIVDRNVIIRQRKRARQLNPKVSSISSLYFDGKQNRTMLDSGKRGPQEHICMITEPGNIYIAQAVTPSKSAETQLNSMLSSLHDVNLTNLEAVGCDGTSTNTGHANGIIARLERFVGHKLHWIVCL